MNIEIPRWHPKYNTYALESNTFGNSDILLISEAEHFVLPGATYPLLQHVDGFNSADNIIAQTSNPQVAATFLYSSKRMWQQDLLVDSREPHNYQKGFACTLETLSDDSALAVYGLTKASDTVKANWLSLIKSSVQQAALSMDQLVILLVDDFINPHLISVIPDQFMLIKITGEQIWLSPRLSKSHFSALQNRLADNKPVRKTLNRLYPYGDHSLPFDSSKCLSADEGDNIEAALVEQLQWHKSGLNEPKISIYDCAKQALSLHPLPTFTEQQLSFPAQLAQPIRLEPCLSLFDHDGGSRHIDPQDTVDRLMKLVSPVTGVITHIQQVQADKLAPICIYQTAFFKTPQGPQQTVAFNHESFILSCMGKGVSAIQSQASALCEAVERSNAQYRPQEWDEANQILLMVKPEDLSKRHYLFDQFVPYSENQYQRFANPQHPDSALKQAAVPYQGQAMHWLPCWSLTQHDQVYLPLTSCFANTGLAEQQYGRWHSNGCAAGNTLEEAILQALFELIERDATAIWWYNQIERPAFDTSQIDPDNFARLSETISREHDFWVLDLTCDIGIAVMAAIGQNRQTGGFCFGFGCHLRPEMAAQRALSELCQLIPIRNQHSAPFMFDDIVDGPYLHPQDEANNAVKAVASVLEHGADIGQDIVNIVDRFNQLGFETLALNYSRGHIPLKTAKVWVPGLCHIWPQLANERLYQVPVNLDWLAEAKTENSIHVQGLYI